MMLDEDADDAPPSLVPAKDNEDSSVAGMESQVEDLSLAKVPITIVTGQSKPRNTAIRLSLDMPTTYLHVLSRTFVRLLKYVYIQHEAHTQHRSLLSNAVCCYRLPWLGKDYATELHPERATRQEDCRDSEWCVDT